VIEAQVVDEHGNLVPTAANLLKFRTTGPGRVVAVDNGSIISHEPFQASERQAFQGRAVAYVRATPQRGKIEVIAEADGLAADSVQLTAAAFGE
jgi:beta-galactosidase